MSEERIEDRGSYGERKGFPCDPWDDETEIHRTQHNNGTMTGCLLDQAPPRSRHRPITWIDGLSLNLEQKNTAFHRHIVGSCRGKFSVKEPSKRGSTLRLATTASDSGRARRM
jgi:hypothetical protein